MLMNIEFKADTSTGNPTGNSRCHTMASRALNMSCSFGQSARSIESRCVVMNIDRTLWFGTAHVFVVSYPIWNIYIYIYIIYILHIRGLDSYISQIKQRSISALSWAPVNPATHGWSPQEATLVTRSQMSESHQSHPGTHAQNTYTAMNLEWLWNDSEKVSLSVFWGTSRCPYVK